MTKVWIGLLLRSGLPVFPAFWSFLGLKLFFGQAAVGHAVGQAVGHAVGHAVGQTPRLLGAGLGAGRARALGWVAPAWRWVSSDVRSLRSCLLGLFVVWRGCEWRGVAYSAFPWFGVAACGLESVLRSGLAVFPQLWSGLEVLVVLLM